MSSFPSYEASSFMTSWDEEDLLGSGSFATARRCIHDEIGKVVVKCFRLEKTSKAKVMNDVEREMKVLSRLKHQHIVAVYGITRWNNCIGIIMEHIDADNLDSFLWLQGDIADIPLLLKLRFSHQISDGLRYLHHHDKKRSYVHCDLKPQNILVTSDLMMKIADFGSVAIAAATGVTGGSITVTSNTQHTPFYTAPELLRNILREKKPSMDVYSYGMVLYAILTRHPAFSSDNPISGAIIEVIKSLGQKPYRPYLDRAESSLKNKPEDLQIFLFLKDIMVRCWDFEAKNRPDMQGIYDEIDVNLRSLNKSDVTFHIADLQRNKKPEPTQTSVKINLSEFLSPFEVGPTPSIPFVTIPGKNSANEPVDGAIEAGTDVGNPQELEALSERISDIYGLMSTGEIDQILEMCKDLTSILKTNSISGNNAIATGNDIINLVKKLRHVKYSFTVLTLLLCAGDLHKKVDNSPEKVKLMEKCADECYRFLERFRDMVPQTSQTIVISRMNGFLESLQKADNVDEKLVVVAKAECMQVVGYCHRRQNDSTHSIEVLKQAISSLESTFNDDCQLHAVYSVCCNNLGWDYLNNDNPEKAEEAYIKSFYAFPKVENVNVEWKMEYTHITTASLCYLYQNHPTLPRENGSDVYNFLQKQEHLTGLPRFWNILSSLRLMILLHLDGDVESIGNELVAMARKISPQSNLRGNLCNDVRETAELLTSNNNDELAKSLLQCADEFEK
ncbi:unnamed protein product [Clavelina lepadiformis]|uniref:Protein kinase domain-containing protein n=2 Tax=Clavelina lepadiformis TaxID=159417 RepID=A0ABP0FUL3_CLALP